uniref:Calmodulin-lysine N-methyltransferase n=1 Tax=Labrus bergylta TaxID=56723 RepID=A0A3Q3GKH0_9LABR
MERDYSATPEETEPALPSRDKTTEDTCADNSHTSRTGTCGATDVAKARWTLLRQVLRQKQIESPEVKQVSVRRFASFDLFSRKTLSTQDPSDTSGDQWVEYRSVHFPEYSALLSNLNFFSLSLSLSDPGVWPSEEVMGAFGFCSFVPCCFISLSFTCLSVSQVAICADVKEVLLSDGNEKSIQSILSSSSPLSVFGYLSISASVVRWDSESDISALEGHFDIVMCADCLFLDQYRASLVDAIRRLLQPNGMALVFAPPRGDTLTLFCQLAQKVGLSVSQHEQYDTQVMDVHLKVRD